MCTQRALTALDICKFCNLFAYIHGGKNQIVMELIILFSNRRQWLTRHYNKLVFDIYYLFRIITTLKLLNTWWGEAESFWPTNCHHWSVNENGYLLPVDVEKAQTLWWYWWPGHDYKQTGSYRNVCITEKRVRNHLVYYEIIGGI